MGCDKDKIFSIEDRLAEIQARKDEIQRIIMAASSPIKTSASPPPAAPVWLSHRTKTAIVSAAIVELIPCLDAILAGVTEVSARADTSPAPLRYKI